MTIPKINRRVDLLYKNLLKDYEKKIYIYFSYKTIGDHYNPREKNYTENNLNPVCLKAYVREIDSEKLIWKNYGNERDGIIEVSNVDKKYKSWFENANKIEIDNQEYMVLKEAVGGNFLISSRPFNKIRVILRKMN